RRALADHDVDLVVLERRVEDLLDHGGQAMDLVDEQDVARLEVGEDRGEVAGALEHRGGSRAQVHAELARDDVGERGLAEPRRAEEQHVVERLGPRARRLDEDLELLAHLLLADVVGELRRAQRALELLLLGGYGLCRREAIGLDGHGQDFANALSAARMPSATGTPGARPFTAASASFSL